MARRTRQQMAQDFMERYIELHAVWDGVWIVKGRHGEGLTQGMGPTLEAAGTDYANQLVRRWSK